MTFLKILSLITSFLKQLVLICLFHRAQTIFSPAIWPYGVEWVDDLLPKFVCMILHPAICGINRKWTQTVQVLRKFIFSAVPKQSVQLV